MTPLFYIDATQKLFLYPDCAKLCPELQGLKDDELLFLVLAFDNYSIYRQFPEADRIRKAMLHVWEDNNPKIMESAKFKLAISAYKSLQYDPKAVLIGNYQKKVDDLQGLFLLETAHTTLKNLRNSITETRSDISDLQNEVLNDVQNRGQIKAGASLGFLEEYLSNEKLYKSVTEKR